jgi:hypothetical protein
MKYIIFEDFAGEPTPIIFPERISFDEMREQIPYTKVLSAGTVQLEKGQIKCSFHPNELELSSLDSDRDVILRHLS